MNWQDYFADKSVAIVGNGPGNTDGANEYDIILRMNEVDYPNGRTDILAMYHFISIEDMLRIKPKYLLWTCFKKRRKPNPYLLDLHFYPLDRWERLNNLLGTFPSTGCQAVDWVNQYTDNWDIFGFSFDKMQVLPPHDMGAEEEYIKKCKAL